MKTLNFRPQQKPFSTRAFVALLFWLLLAFPLRLHMLAQLVA